MAAAATPEPPTTTLLELALAAGYRVSHQRRRAAAACAGTDPELFLPERGQSLADPMSYCTRCEVRTECLREAFALGSGAVGVWGGTSTQQRTVARRRGWDAERLLAELDGR
jgi:WhiB family transcriptional regulator, redox-sensing transcriptional regulator